MSRLRRAVELLDSKNKIVYAWPMRTVLPFSAVSNAIDFLVESNRAAYGNIGLRRSVSCSLATLLY